MTDFKIEELDFNDRETLTKAYHEALAFAHENECAVIYTYGNKPTLVIQNSWEQGSGHSVRSAAKIISVFKLINEYEAEVEIDKTRDRNYIITLPHDKAKESRTANMARADELCRSLNGLLNTDRARPPFSFDKTTGIITHVRSVYALPDAILAEISTQQQQQQQLARA